MSTTRRLVACAALVLLARGARADVKLPTIFGNHMVLQEGRKLPFWGTADAGETVTVTIGADSRETKAAADGRWRLEMPPLTGPGPVEVVVRGRNTIKLTDVLVGEVWVASGQSNMEWSVLASDKGEVEAQGANVPTLRLFQVKRPDPRKLADRPVEVEGRWAPTTPESAITFSAVGYYFGRELQRQLGRPVGIVHSSWGGTPAEAWTSRKTLQAHPSLRHLLVPLAKAPGPDVLRAYDEATARFLAAAGADQGTPDENPGLARGFAKPDAPISGWLTTTVPGAWEDTTGQDLDAIVWFRREIELPSAFVGQHLTLRLGGVDECDATYVNGVKVGATCREQPHNARWPRAYPVPAALTKARKLVIAVRVRDDAGKGGIIGPRESVRLVLGDKPDGPSVPLAGLWSYRIERELRRGANVPPPRPPGMVTQNSPGYLYDNMLAALIPYGIRGAIWYQGESNTKRAFQYRTLLPTMIEDWRKAWGQGAFPFLIVQLANYRPRWPGAGQRSEDEWAELREAQALVAAKHPGAGLAVTVDIGDRNDIHPLNKQEVGRRLALQALAKVYDQAVEHSGPVYAGHTVERGPDKTARVRVRFKHAGGLSVAGPPGERLFGFEVAGSDRRYVNADARIDGDTVVLTAPTVAQPVAVRYGWSDDPLCNLVNWAGLPGVPFRSDKWPGLTVNRK